MECDLCGEKTDDPTECIVKKPPNLFTSLSLCDACLNKVQTGQEPENSYFHQKALAQINMDLHMTLDEEEIHRLAQAIMKLYAPHHTDQIKAASVGVAVGRIASANPNPDGFLMTVARIAQVTVDDVRHRSPAG